MTTPMPPKRAGKVQKSAETAVMTSSMPPKNAVKWVGAVVAIAGLAGSVVDLYREKAAIEATSLRAEEEMAQTVEELQATVVELDTRVGEPVPDKKAERKARKLRKAPRVWQMPDAP